MIRVLALVTALTALTVLVEWALPHEAHFPPGTTALFALVACLLIVAFSKISGLFGLQRSEPKDE